MSGSAISEQTGEGGSGWPLQSHSRGLSRQLVVWIWGKERDLDQKQKSRNVADAASVPPTLLWHLPCWCVLAHLSIANNCPQGLLYLWSWQAGRGKELMLSGSSPQPMTRGLCTNATARFFFAWENSRVCFMLFPGASQQD